MNKNNRLASIIIPCYNREGYLPATIESCLCQIYRDIEIIIIDDGSTDRTLEVARKYEGLDSRIKVFDFEHQGQCAARNAGLSRSCGRYVKFLDSDDLLLPYSIEYQIKVLEFFHAEMTVAGSLGFKDAELGKAREELPAAVSFLPKDNIVKSILSFIKWGKGSTGDIMFLGKLLRETGGFDPELKAAEELNLWLRIATAFPGTMVAYQVTPKLLLKRIGHESQSAQPANIKWVLLSLRNAAEFYLKKLPQNTELEKYIFDRLYTAMTYGYRSGFRSEALRAFSAWKKAGLNPPALQPWYHNRLHRILGFTLTEQALAMVRKIR